MIVTIIDNDVWYSLVSASVTGDSDGWILDLVVLLRCCVLLATKIR